MPVIGRPKWVGIPNVRDLSAVMPPKAREAKVYKARVQMSCKVAAGGTVEGCAVETEDPLGMGWGEAAVTSFGVLVGFYGPHLGSR